MATVQSVIEIVFNGIDNTSQVLNDLGGALGEFDGQLQGIAEPLADFAGQLVVAEAAALGFGAALIGMSINAAGNFDTSFREITTLTDQTIEGLSGFRTELMAYAATSTQSLNQVTQATYNAISQGVDYTRSLEAVTVAEKLAVAGKADLNGTLNALLGTLNAYGKGMDSAGEFSDIFFTTVKLGKTTIPELSAVLSGVTSTATLGGVSFQELGAAIATITAAGAPSSQAVTRINAALSAIITPSSQAAELAKQLGIAFDANALKSKGLAGVLEEVREKTGGAADKMGILFGSTDALNAVNVLAITNADKFKTNLEAMSKAAGATDAAFAKMKDATDTLAQALTVSLVSFGTPLLEQFNAAEDAVASLAGAFIQVSEGGGLKPLQGLINDSLGGIAETIEKVAENLPAAFEQLDWTGLIDSLGELGTAVGSLFEAFLGDVDLRTVEGLSSALQTVMNTFEALTRVVTGIVGEFRPFADAIGEIIRHFNDLDDASKLEFGQTLGGMKLLVDAGTGLGLALIAIGRAGLDMGDALDVAFGIAKVGINSLQVTFDAVVLGFLNIRASALSAAIAFNEFANGGETFKSSQWKKELADLTIVLDSVAANLERNKTELEQGYNQATGAATEKTAALRKGLDAGEAALRATGAAAKTVTGELMDWSDGLRQANEGVKENKDFVKAAEGTLMDWSDGLKDAKATTIAWGDSIKGLPPIKPPEGVEKLEGIFKTAGKEAGNYATAIEGVSTSYSQIGTGTIKATGAFAAVADKTEEAKKQLEALTKSGKLSVDQLLELTKTANDFKVQMEEIASNERIKTIEFAVNLQTAKLETDMERVKAAFASIDSTVQSTGDLLGSLFGNLADAGTYDKLDIKSQIDLENKRRQEALDIQKKLAEAEIERIEAQTAALNRGDALIRIDGTGLAPELEAFMWKILGAIRTRANAEFADYLLGMGV